MKRTVYEIAEVLRFIIKAIVLTILCMGALTAIIMCIMAAKGIITNM